MVHSHKQTEKLLQRLDAAWTDLARSYAGLSDAQMTVSGVIEDWSIKDIIAHVTTWEAEALKHLPVIMAGGAPPRYVTYGGLDAFNLRMSRQMRELSLANVLHQRDDTHERLVDFVRNAPQDTFAGETRARRRLRLDSYSHYPLHAEAIREWRLRVPAILSEQDSNHAE